MMKNIKLTLHFKILLQEYSKLNNVRHILPSSENLHEVSLFQASNSFDFESTCRATSAFNKISVLGCSLEREHN
jgi:hypothetical protein